MAISHLCLSCGRDLARDRPRREPIYGLPLVTCPRCGAHAVRRLHPHRLGWRRLRRLAATLLAAVLQLALAVGLVAATIALCMVWPLTYRERGAALLDEQWMIMPAVLTFVVLPAALGMWLTAGLGHWNRGTPWAVFAVVVTALLALDTVIAPMIMRGLKACGATIDPLPFDERTLSARVVVLAVVMIFATAGIAPGRLARRGWHRFTAARWRARRRRRRAGRALT